MFETILIFVRLLLKESFSQYTHIMLKLCRVRVALRNVEFPTSAETCFDLKFLVDRLFLYESVPILSLCPRFLSLLMFRPSAP